MLLFHKFMLFLHREIASIRFAGETLPLFNKNKLKMNDSTNGKNFGGLFEKSVEHLMPLRVWWA